MFIGSENKQVNTNALRQHEIFQIVDWYNSIFHAQGKYWLSKMESYTVLVLLFSCFIVIKMTKGYWGWMLGIWKANMKSCQSKTWMAYLWTKPGKMTSCQQPIS